MKALLGMLVAISLVSGGSAFGAAKKTQNGQAVTKKNVKRQKAKSKARARAKPAVTAPVTGTTGGATVAPSTAATTSAAPISTAVVEDVPKRWSVLIDSWNEADLYDEKLGRPGDLMAYQLIRVSYKLSPVLSLSLANNFSHSWGYTSDNRRKFSYDDPYLMLAHSKLLGPMPAGLNSKGYLRFYPGISESSRNKGTVGFLRGQFNIGRDFGKVVRLAWETQPRYYFQNYKTFTRPVVHDEDGNRLSGGDERANIQARIKHFGNLGLKLSSKVNIYQNLGMDYVWSHSDPEATNPENRDVPHGEYLFAETGLGYSLNDNLSFAVGIYSELKRNLLDQKNDFSIYRADESLYFLEGTVSF